MHLFIIEHVVDWSKRSSIGQVKKNKEKEKQHIIIMMNNF